MPIVQFGNNDNNKYGNVYVEATGTAINVSYAAPVVIAVPFYKMVDVHRIMVRRIAPINAGTTTVELFRKSPSDPAFKEWHRLYKSDEFNSDAFLDDELQNRLLYASADGVDTIWMRITPSQGNSNNYEFFINGKKMVSQ